MSKIHINQMSYSQVKKLIYQYEKCIENNYGYLKFTRHAKKNIADLGYTMGDIKNILSKDNIHSYIHDGGEGKSTLGLIVFKSRTRGLTSAFAKVIIDLDSYTVVSVSKDYVSRPLEDIEEVDYDINLRVKGECIPKEKYNE